MPLHHLPSTPETVHWGFLDAALPPVLQIASGDSVRIDTVSSGRSRMPQDRERFGILPDHEAIVERMQPWLGPHILTGPVGLEGAEPGDLLAVRVESVSLRQNWGWNELHPGVGALPEIETEIELATIPLDLASSRVELPWGAAVPARPFFGVMAVKPPAELGPLTSLVPGAFGGNMDVRLFGPGATIYFPVHVAEAGFSVGDGHALQGDGEVIGTAVETALTGVFRFDLEKQAAETPFPFAETSDALVTLAVDEDLDVAAVEALRQGVALLSRRFGLSPREAYRHVSLLGDLVISQLVNIKKGVHCRIDTRALSKQATA